MRILVDTHILLWMASDDPMLSRKARELIGNDANAVYFSPISIWEIAIKHDARPDKMPVDARSFSEGCREAGLVELPLSAAHVSALPTLVRHDGAPPQKDPFDWMLLAQAKSEGMMLLSHDARLCEYDEPSLIRC